MERTTKRHHIVIGDGLTAAEFAKNTIMSRGERLTIIGPNVEGLGRGLAYSKVASDRPWHMAYLLNSPSEGVDPDFGEWVRDNWDDIAERMKGKEPDWLASGEAYISQGDYSALNAPRELFGDYLCSLVDQQLKELVVKGVIVNRVATCVRDIEYDSSQKQLHVLLDTGQTLVASHVDIATGGVQTQSLFDADGKYSFAQLYGNEEVLAERIKQGGSVVCLGANAAMLDSLRLAQSILPNTSLDFIAISPSAQLPEPLIPSQPRKRAMVDLKPHYASAQDLFLAFSKQMDGLRQQGYRMADMRGSFKTAILDVALESLLADSNEARKVLGLVERLFLRGTRDSLADFQLLQDKGQVRLVAGQLEEAKVENGALLLTIGHSDGEQEAISATALVNCAGAGKTLRFDKMTEILLEKGWMKRCSVSGGLEVDAELKAGPSGLRYLSSAVTVIGGKALAFSLYDASGLRAVVRGAVMAANLRG